MFPDFTPRPHLVVAAAAPHEKLVAAAADRLDAPVPCDGWTVRDLAEHMLTWTPVLAGAGRGTPPEPGSSSLEGDWTGELTRDRDDLVAVWSDPTSWQGTTTMTSSELPSAVVGTMTFCELVLHAWDLARGLGETVTWDDALLEEAHEALSQLTPLGRQMGAFGPAVDVAPDAPLLDRVVAVAGRDPGLEALTSPREGQDGLMSDIDPADLARLRSRAWSGDAGEARAECAAHRRGHLAVVITADEPPRCEHCGETLSPDALRKAGYKPERS